MKSGVIFVAMLALFNVGYYSVRRETILLAGFVLIGLGISCWVTP